MQGKFEKNIEQQLSSFSLEPSPQVWQDVENALYPRRKDRGILWWWVPLLGLLLAGGGWWMFHSINQTKKSIPSIIIQNKKAIEENLRVDTNKQNALVQSTAETKNIEKKEKPVLKQKVHINSAVTPDTKAIQQNKLITVNKENTVTMEAIHPLEPTTVSSTTVVTGKINVDDKLPLKIADTSNIVVEKNNSVITATNKKNLVVELQKDSAMATAVTKKANQNNNKSNKNQWLITVGIGSLNVNQPSLFSITQNSQSFVASPNVFSGGGGSTKEIASPKDGFSFFAGITYEHKINKRWTLNTGLQYRYLQNKQYTGIDSVTTTADHYYAAGDTSFKINYAYCLQVPLGLAYSINPSAKNKFQLLFGGSLAWALGEKWLATNTNNSRYPYHYDAGLYNSFLFNLHAGIGYNCSDRFQISLLAEQSLTPIHKQTAEKYYRQQFSLQISKPLHLSQRKHKPSKT